MSSTTDGANLLPISIQTEDQAISYLEAALKDAENLGDLRFNFDEWPKLKLDYKGEKFHGTITPDIAQFVLELQEALNRCYMMSVFQTSNLRGFPDSSRKSIAVEVTVTEGSSIVEIDLTDWATALATELIGKMTGPEIVTVILGCGVLLTGGWLVKRHMDNRSAEKRISLANKERFKLSQEETKRLAIVTAAMNANQIVKETESNAELVRDSLIRSAFDAESLTIQEDLSIDSDDAKKTYRSKRREPIDVQLNGNYIIRQFGWVSQSLAKAKVKRITGNPELEFGVDINFDNLDSSGKNVLKEVTFDQTEVYLCINATMLNDQITSADVISASKPSR